MQINPVPKLALAAILALTPILAQNPSTPPADNAQYILGPGDEITVFLAELPDQFNNKTFRIDSSGDLSLPTIGHLHAQGLTTNQLEQAANASLARIIKKPQVYISLAAFGSESVAVLGAVNNPGMRQLEGHKTLFEMLSLAGGLRTDAGYLVKVSRRQSWGLIPVPGATVDPTGQTSTASIKLRNIIDEPNAADNIAIFPGDTISVPRAQIVYAVGYVVKPGGFALNEHESMSALQVVSLAEGLQKTAATTKAKILRTVPGEAERIEIPVDLKKLMAGKTADVKLQAQDILFVPNSAGKSVGYRAIDSIVALTTGLVIYGKL